MNLIGNRAKLQSVAPVERTCRLWCSGSDEQIVDPTHEEVTHPLDRSIRQHILVPAVVSHRENIGGNRVPVRTLGCVRVAVHAGCHPPAIAITVVRETLDSS